MTEYPKPPAKRIISAVGLAAALCGAAAPPLHAQEWRAEHYRDHPLVGRIWDVRSQSYLSEAELFDRLAATDHVLLGERHDNPDHHILQARVVREIVRRGRRPAVALEMLDETQEAALAAHLTENPEDARGLGPAVGWEQSGWPAWEDYMPIVEAALEADLPLATANIDRGTARQMVREGREAMPPERWNDLQVPEPLPQPVADLQTAAVVEGHCGLMPEDKAGPMVRVQAVRDAVMARAMVTGASQEDVDGAVLIAGAGHARRDAGVPWHLFRFGVPPGEVAAVALTEVAPDVHGPADYAGRHGTAQPPFDYLWFTPVADLTDHCAQLRERFGSSGGH